MTQPRNLSIFADGLNSSGVAGVSVGGTGTSTAFTAGSVVFAGTSGVYNQSNSTLFWDNSNKRLGIGTSSPVSSLVVSNSGNEGMEFGPGYAGGRNYIQNYNRATSQYTALDSIASTYTWQISGVEKMRLNGSGDLLVGTTSISISGSLIAGNGYVCRSGSSGSFGNNSFNLYWTGSAVQLWIDTSNLGNITYTSDYRVKSEIQTQSKPALDRVMQIRPVTYNLSAQNEHFPFFAGDGITREGFIAHELAEIIPSAVEGEKDDPNQVQSLRLDALCSVLVKAIQELKSDFEAYKASRP
jgi:Chaperone of endosialidase